MSISFTVAVVTRNRADALALSLPLFVADAVKPKSVLIVDSSDDPTENLATVARVAATTEVPIIHRVSPPGMTVQRNIALGMVDTEVVVFPDDDSLVHPGALAEMMRVYERDHEGVIAGVCGLEVSSAPAGTIEVSPRAYRKRRLDRVKLAIQPRLNRFEQRWAPDPLKLAANSLYAGMGPPPSWLVEMDARRVEWMTGFRMSFRTEVIKRIRFNENLGRYALYEDIDVSLACIRLGYNIVGAHRAPIYHHRSPENRAAGRQMGAMLLLNRAYVLCRRGFATPEMEDAMLRFGAFRIAQLGALAARDRFQRDKMNGAIAAQRRLPRLFAAPPEQLDATYLAIRAEAVGGA